jgi:aminomethyltransferase
MDEGFSGTQAAKVVGITYRQLDYWARTDLIRPSLTDAAGSGSRRRYSYKDLVELRVIKTLLDAGIKLESVREVFEYLREHLDSDIASAHLVISGSSVVLAEGDELIDVLAKGQGVLNVLSLAGVKHEVDTQLVPLAGVDLPLASIALTPCAPHRSTPFTAPLGAKMVPFGGWEMPLDYGSTIEEHLACRHDAVMFDVSHLGTVRVTGDSAFDTLQRQLTNDLRKVAPGPRPVHPPARRERRVGRRRHHRLVASDRRRAGVRRDAERVEHRPCGRAVGGIDTTATRAVIAVQGPSARERVGTFWSEAAAVGRFRVAPCTWMGVQCVVAGTGYTGEPGLEIAAPVDLAPSLWRALADAGVRPAGLGARDTCGSKPACRCTATSSGQASPRCRRSSAGWSAGTSRRSEGVTPSRRARAGSRHRLLVGIATEGRRPPRAEAAVLVDDTSEWAR